MVKCTTADEFAYIEYEFVIYASCRVLPYFMTCFAILNLCEKANFSSIVLVDHNVDQVGLTEQRVPVTSVAAFQSHN